VVHGGGSWRITTVSCEGGVNTRINLYHHSLYYLADGPTQTGLKHELQEELER